MKGCKIQKAWWIAIVIRYRLSNPSRLLEACEVISSFVIYAFDRNEWIRVGSEVFIRVFCYNRRDFHHLSFPSAAGPLTPRFEPKYGATDMVFI